MKRVKKRHYSFVSTFCKADKAGPRIPTLLREFERSSPVSTHLRWIEHLKRACESQGCYIAECVGLTDVSFWQTHGAKTLVNGIMVLLTFHVPRWVKLKSDNEWRELLAAIRTFHSFCVRRGYVKYDSVLITALYRLRQLGMYSIPQRLQELTRERYWDTLEEEQATKRGSETTEGDSAVLVTGGYDMYIGEEMRVNVDEVLTGGWVMTGEDEEEREKAFLTLPDDVARLGMRGMSLSCLLLARRNGVWRPVVQEEEFRLLAYAPDDVFYY